jgi:hypothetical protein
MGSLELWLNQVMAWEQFIYQRILAISNTTQLLKLLRELVRARLLEQKMLETDLKEKLLNL